MYWDVAARVGNLLDISVPQSKVQVRLKNDGSTHPAKRSRMREPELVKRNRRWRIGLLILGILLSVVLVVLMPWNISNISSRPRPVKDYAEATQRIEAWQMEDKTAMNPVCQLQFMTHGGKVTRAIVLVHGYTNCPQQFHDLGLGFYDLGYNVLIAPLPYHGYIDRMTEAHGQLTAEDLASYTDQTIDIAQGLGDQVIVMGLSAGGVMVSWAAQNRSDVTLAVIIAPGFGFNFIPTLLTAAVMNVFTLLPDGFQWWDPMTQAKTPPVYAYPRFSQHALAQILRLGFVTQVDAQHRSPTAKQIIVVTNANDIAVNNDLTREVVKTWQAHGANLSTYEFEAKLNLDHDIIDPNQPHQQVDVVYPRLINLVNQK